MEATKARTDCACLHALAAAVKAQTRVLGYAFSCICGESALHMQTLAELQDQLDSFPTPIAQALIERELGCTVAAAFSELSAEPKAAASLGQVRTLTPLAWQGTRVHKHQCREPEQVIGCTLATAFSELSAEPTAAARRGADSSGSQNQFAVAGACLAAFCHGCSGQPASSSQNTHKLAT